MKKILCLTIIIAATSCGETDNRRRTPDPRFVTQGCINDSTEQEIFDEKGKAYYEYVPCDPGQNQQESLDNEKSPCVNDSMETERFDDEGNVYYIKVPC